MSTTPRPALLSDEQIIEEQEAWGGSIDGGELAKKHQTYTARWVRDFYEAARAKDAELIQHLVNELVMLQYVFASETGYETRWGDDALAAAAAAGFTPTEP